MTEEKRALTAEQPLFVGKSEKWFADYNSICSAITAHEEEVVLLWTTNEETMENLLTSAFMDLGQLHGAAPWCDYYYNEQGHIIGIGLKYWADEAQLDHWKSSIDKFVDDLVKDAEKWEDDYNKLVSFTWQLISHVQYGPYATVPDDPFDKVRVTRFTESQSLKGVFFDRQAVCLGFSRALAMICNRANIECSVVLGEHEQEANGNKHAWNMVVLDGEPYYIDLVASLSTIRKREDLEYGWTFLFLMTEEDLANFGYRPWMRPFRKAGRGEKALINQWVSVIDANYQPQASMSSIGTPAQKAS